MHGPPVCAGHLSNGRAGRTQGESEELAIEVMWPIPITLSYFHSGKAPSCVHLILDPESRSASLSSVPSTLANALAAQTTVCDWYRFGPPRPPVEPRCFPVGFPLPFLAMSSTTVMRIVDRERVYPAKYCMALTHSSAKRLAPLHPFTCQYYWLLFDPSWNPHAC